MKKISLLIALSLQGAPVFAADFSGTVALIEPVTQRTSIFFIIEQEDAVLKAGCTRKGDGMLDISIQPKRYTDEPVESVFNPSQHRFAGDEKVYGGHWRVVSGSRLNELQFDDVVFGGTARKTRFVDDLSKSSALHVRYWVGRNSNSISFNLNAAVSMELRKMVQACQPKGVLSALAKAQSILAAPLDPNEAFIPSISR